MRDLAGTERRVRRGMAERKDASQRQVQNRQKPINKEAFVRTVPLMFGKFTLNIRETETSAKPQIKTTEQTARRPLAEASNKCKDAQYFLNPLKGSKPRKRFAP